MFCFLETLPRRLAEVFVLQTGEEIRIELDAIRCVMGSARSAVIAKGLPETLVAQIVEGLPESGPAAPSLLHDGPVGIEAEAKVGRLAEFGSFEFTALGQIDDAEQKQWFMRREAGFTLQATATDSRV